MQQTLSRQNQRPRGVTIVALVLAIHGILDVLLGIIIETSDFGYLGLQSWGGKNRSLLGWLGGGIAGFVPLRENMPI